MSTIVYQPGAILEPTDGAWANPGDQVVYWRYLTNLGNYTDTFQINVSSLFGWTTPSTYDVTLGVQEVYTITLVVNVPNEAKSGQHDVATIDVTSQLDPEYMLGQGVVTNIYHRYHLPLVIYNP